MSPVRVVGRGYFFFCEHCDRTGRPPMTISDLIGGPVSRSAALCCLLCVVSMEHAAILLCILVHALSIGDAVLFHLRQRRRQVSELWIVNDALEEVDDEMLAFFLADYGPAMGLPDSSYRFVCVNGAREGSDRALHLRSVLDLARPLSLIHI